MTTERRIRANRINARASTGPRTVLGKLNSSKNAYRHGLNISIFADPARSPEVENLALEIAGARASPELIELARRVAEAQMDLARVRKERHDQLSINFNDANYRPNIWFKDSQRLMRIIGRHLRQWGPETPLPLTVSQYSDHLLQWKPEGAEKFAYILSDLSRRLIAMDRYERRALSRRKFAIREFDAARKSLEAR